MLCSKPNPTLPLMPGSLPKHRELTRRASESAQRADEKETAAAYVAEAAWREALVGNMNLAKQQAQAALALSTGRDVEAVSAIAPTRSAFRPKRPVTYW